MTIWISRDRHLGISIGIDVGISIGIAKKIFCLAKLFFFCLFSYIMKKTYMIKSFSSTLAHIPGSFRRCVVQLFEAPASEERNSKVDVISGVLKTLKAESCILQVCKFLIRNPIRDHFLEVFCKF